MKHIKSLMLWTCLAISFPHLINAGSSSESTYFKMIQNVTIKAQALTILNKTQDEICALKCSKLPGCEHFFVNSTGSPYLLASITSITRTSDAGYLYLKNANTILSDELFAASSQSTIHFDDDGLLYTILDGSKSSWQEAYDSCKQFEGFRLAQTKTLTSYELMKMLIQLYSIPNGDAVGVDLQLNATVDFFGDGTLFMDSELDPSVVLLKNTNGTDIYIFLYGRLNDFISNNTKFPVHALCQANPFDVSW